MNQSCCVDLHTKNATHFFIVAAAQQKLGPDS